MHVSAASPAIARSDGNTSEGINHRILRTGTVGRAPTPERISVPMKGSGGSPARAVQQVCAIRRHEGHPPPRGVRTNQAFSCPPVPGSLSPTSRPVMGVAGPRSSGALACWLSSGPGCCVNIPALAGVWPAWPQSWACIRGTGCGSPRLPATGSGHATRELRYPLPWTPRTCSAAQPPARADALIHESHVQRQVRRTHPADEAKRLKADLSHQDPCAARIFGITRETRAPTQHRRNRSMTNS